MREKTLRIVMAAPRNSVFVFARVHCMSSPASCMDGVADMVGEWLSLSEWLLFQSVSKNISFQLEEELERKVWGSIKADDWASQSNERDQYWYGTQGNAFAFSEGR